MNCGLKHLNFVLEQKKVVQWLCLGFPGVTASFLLFHQLHLLPESECAWLYPKSPPIPSFTIPYISPLIQFTWRSEWKWVSEFGHWVHQKDCRFCIVCLLFNNHLKRAAPVVRLKDLSWTLSQKLCINPNSQFTINLYLCCITRYYAVDEHF